MLRLGVREHGYALSHARHLAKPDHPAFTHICFVLCFSHMRCTVWHPASIRRSKLTNFTQTACQTAILFCAWLHVVLQSQEVPDVWLQVLARCARSDVHECESEAIAQLVSLTTAQQIGEPDTGHGSILAVCCTRFGTTVSVTSCTQLVCLACAHPGQALHRGMLLLFPGVQDPPRSILFTPLAATCHLRRLPGSMVGYLSTLHINIRTRNAY
jgi:hypothetical protein